MWWPICIRVYRMGIIGSVVFWVDSSGYGLSRGRPIRHIAKKRPQIRHNLSNTCLKRNWRGKGGAASEIYNLKCVFDENTWCMDKTIHFYLSVFQYVSFKNFCKDIPLSKSSSWRAWGEAKQRSIKTRSLPRETLIRKTAKDEGWGWVDAERQQIKN